MALWPQPPRLWVYYRDNVYIEHLRRLSGALTQIGFSGKSNCSIYLLLWFTKIQQRETVSLCLNNALSLSLSLPLTPSFFEPLALDLYVCFVPKDMVVGWSCFVFAMQAFQSKEKKEKNQSNGCSGATVQDKASRPKDVCGKQRFVMN